MELYLDTANLEEIKKWSEIFPIDGITTNPTLLAKSGEKAAQVIEEIYKIIGDDKKVHAQTLAKDFDGIIKEADMLSKLHDNLFVKIPVTLEGFRAIRKLSSRGMNITATAIATAHQGFLAAKAGVKYVAPYINRIDNLSSDGFKVADDLLKIFDNYKYETKVVAASFKNAQQVLNLMTAGVHAVTLPVDVLEHMAKHPLTDISNEGFIEDYRKVFGSTQL